MATKKKQEVNRGNKGKIAGMAAVAAAAAAGAYFLYGKDGSKNRKKIKGWMLKAKGEVLEQLEKGKEVTQEKYDQVIDKVGQKYRAAKNIDPLEIEQMVRELKGHWTSIKKQLTAADTKKK